MKRVFFFSLFILFTCRFSSAGTATEQNYVLIISLDGFRWDYPNRGLTPNLNQLADRGVKALSFQPVFPSKTFPNHYSIATGLYPQNHGIVSNHFPDHFSGREYRVGDTSAVRDDRWYRGESIWETVQREGLMSASFFWPGSETRLPYKHPTYFKRYDGSISHEDRIDGIIDWLKLPEKIRPQLLFLYFSDTDTYGHQYGPNSPEINKAITLLDEKIGLIQKRIEQINMSDRVNIIVLSDHGMAELDSTKIIDLSKIIETASLELSGHGPLVQIFSDDKEKRADINRKLKQAEDGYRVYLKKDIPDYLKYRFHPFIDDLLVLAENGCSLVKDAEAAGKFTARGDHGYDARLLDMHGIFYGAGPAFKSNYKTGTLLNIDVYPLVCEILNVTPSQMIDGQLERIKHLLKE